jgi:hypothetical protein
VTNDDLKGAPADAADDPIDLPTSMRVCGDIPLNCWKRAPGSCSKAISDVGCQTLSSVPSRP